MPELRRLAFGLIVAAMAGALLWCLEVRSPRGAPTPATPQVLGTTRPTNRRPAIPSRARFAARRFVSAFLAYEVDPDIALRQEVRGGASGAFARELLRRRVRPEAGRARVRIGALDLHRLPDHRGLILVSGTAARPSGPEPFAFLFARRPRGWIALAPAE